MATELSLDFFCGRCGEIFTRGLAALPVGMAVVCQACGSMDLGLVGEGEMEFFEVGDGSCGFWGDLDQPEPESAPIFPKSKVKLL